MLHLVTFGSSDVSIGRVEKSSLSQQTLMELFIDGIEDPQQIYGDTNRENLSQWSGITVSSTDEVRTVNWRNKRLTGSVSLEWLPESINELYLYETFLKGEIHTELFPPTLLRASFQRNSYTGSIDLSALPKTMVLFSASENKLSGSVHLELIPDAMESLFLYINDFTGALNLTALPKHMNALLLYENRFCGNLDLTRLPGTLRSLGLQKNCFFGVIAVENLPPHISLNFSLNSKLSGEIVLPAANFHKVNVEGTGIRKVDRNSGLSTST